MFGLGVQRSMPQVAFRVRKLTATLATLRCVHVAARWVVPVACWHPGSGQYKTAVCARDLTAWWDIVS